MDNKLIDRGLVERYVLNQLGDEELALFRGQLMFDEELRKEVVRTKMLLGGLQTIAAQAGITPSSSSTTGLFSTQIIGRAAAVIGALLLIGGLAYFWSTSNNTNTNTKEEISAPAANQVTPTPNTTTTIEDNQEESHQKRDNSKTVKPADQSKSNPKPKEKKDKDDDLIFASSKKDFIDIEFSSTYDNEPSLGFADIAFAQNDYLEDAIDNSILKSDSPIVNLQLNRKDGKFKLDKNNKIELGIDCQILTKIPNANYTLKFYSNKEEDFVENLPKHQHIIKTKKISDGIKFHLDFKIKMPKGLYYYIIEEEFQVGEGDMIHVGKFTVED